MPTNDKTFKDKIEIIFCSILFFVFGIISLIFIPETWNKSNDFTQTAINPLGAFFMLLFALFFFILSISIFSELFPEKDDLTLPTAFKFGLFIRKILIKVGMINNVDKR